MEIDLNHSLGFRINKVASQLNTTFNHALYPFGIALEQRVALEIIKEEENVTLTKVSSMLSKDKTTISRTLRTLEKKGFIEKHDNSEDRRVSFIKLTLKGEETLAKTKESIIELRKSLISQMSEKEVKEFLRLLDKVNLA